MLMSSHFFIANSILENIDKNKSFLINEKHFIYGNIKPDVSSKYLFMKHYHKESFDMIVKKINHLCNLNLDSLSKKYCLNKFNQEIGVICHFLCDFFCVPHSQRWEFKHSMKKHMFYEKELSYVAKELNLAKFKGDIITHNSFEEFFFDLYNEYINVLSYKNDLLFSSFACNSIINYILECILDNSLKFNTLVHCL